MLLSNHRLDAPAGTVAFLSYTELQADTKSCMTFDFAISVSTFLLFYFKADAYDIIKMSLDLLRIFVYTKR